MFYIVIYVHIYLYIYTIHAMNINNNYNKQGKDDSGWEGAGGLSCIVHRVL